MVCKALHLSALVDLIPTLENKKERFGVVPGHRAHDVEASDCVFELFGRGTVSVGIAYIEHWGRIVEL